MMRGIDTQDAYVDTVLCDISLFVRVNELHRVYQGVVG